MSNEQPEALRLAEHLEHCINNAEDGTLSYLMYWSAKDAATELRRLYAENSALAAGQCTEGGPWGDEGGTPYCKLKEVNSELVGALEKYALPNLLKLTDSRAKTDYWSIKDVLIKAKGETE